MAPSAELLRSDLLEVQAEQKDPNAVNCEHDHAMTDREIVVLGKEVVGDGAHLTLLKLAKHCDGLRQGDYWG